jgi:hypothetical protein
VLATYRKTHMRGLGSSNPARSSGQSAQPPACLSSRRVAMLSRLAIIKRRRQGFKRMVRILKNMRGRLVDDRVIASDCAPS